MSGRSLRLRTVAERLGSRWCCSWQVAVAMIVLGLVVTTGWGTARGGLTFAEFFAVEILADSAGAVVLFVASVTVMRHRRQRTVPLGIVIGVWATIGMVRGLVLSRFYLLDPAQVISGTATLAAWALLLIYLAATFVESQERATRLESANAELRAIRGSMQDVLDEERLRLIRAVQNSVTPEIARLRALIAVLNRPVTTHQISELADRLAAYSSGVIRQTSQDLRREETRPRQRSSAWDAPVRPPSVLMSYAAGAQPIIVPMALVTLRALSVWASQGDRAAAVAGLAGLVLVAAVATVCRQVLDRLLRRPSPGELIATTALIGLVACALTGIFHWAREGAMGPTYVPLVVIFAFVLAVLVAARLVAGLEDRRARQAEELTQVNADLERANRELQDELHEVREQLAGILHGPVQGRLAAASMALRMYVTGQEAGDATDLGATVTTATTLLDRAQVDIERIGGGGEDTYETLGEGVERIATNWSGLLAIEFVEDDGWSRSPEFIAGCIDVISELVTNASRHGDARSMAISLRGRDADSVVIDAIDDGSGPSRNVHEGQGLAGVRRWQGTWHLERNPSGGTRVTVTLSD